MFPLKSLELFKENSTRYEFAAKFTRGRVYDYSPGEFMSYFGAKILLENEITKEVINFNAFEKNSKLTKRIRLKDGSIDFSIIDNNLTENSLFDTAISFDTIQFESDYDKFLKNFSNLLKKDGTLILSIPNSKVNPTVKNKFTGFTRTHCMRQKKNVPRPARKMSNEIITMAEIPNNLGWSKVISKHHSRKDKIDGENTDTVMKEYNGNKPTPETQTDHETHNDSTRTEKKHRQ